MGPQGPVGPQGPAGEPGSRDISFGSQNNVISLRTPSLTEAFYNKAYVDGMLLATDVQMRNKANIVHTHAASDLTGALPACASGKTQPLCTKGNLLVVGGVTYAPTPSIAGQPVITSVISNIKLGTAVNTWNTIGAFDDVANSVVSMNGSVQTAVGTFAAVNASSALQVRIVGGQVQEFHTQAAHQSLPLYLEVRFVPPSTSQAEDTAAL